MMGSLDATTFWTAVGALGVLLGVFWTAVAAVGTLLGAGAVIFAFRQLRFDAWLKCQDLFTDKCFTDARTRLFSRLDAHGPWSDECSEKETDDGYLLCRKLDELARLAPYLGGDRKLVEVWDDPFAKAWFLLRPLVDHERQKTRWEAKWDAFERIGNLSLKRRAARTPEWMSKPRT